MSFLSNLICHFTVTLNAVDWGSLPVKLHMLAGKSPSQISSLAERAGCKLYKVKKYNSYHYYFRLQKWVS